MSKKHIKSRALIVPASAGSGKTFRIAEEYIYDVLRNRFDENGSPYFDDKFYKRILAVTFTNKATEEMKTRILKEIHTLASGAKSDHLETLMEKTSLSEAELRRRAMVVRSNILHDYSHFTVLTNDAFFQRILRAFVRELNIDMNFSTEIDTAPLLAKSVDALIHNVADEPSLCDWLSEIAEDRILEGKSWNFRNAVTSLTGELFNEAARDIIAKCKSKEEFSEILKKLEEKVQTENEELEKTKKRLQTEASLIISTYQLEGSVSKNALKLFSADNPFASDTMKKYHEMETEKWFNANKYTEHKAVGVDKLKDILGKILPALQEPKTWQNTLTAFKRNYRSFALLKELQTLIALESKRENSMLLSDTKHILWKFIKDTDAPFIYEKVGNYFDKFMIDEFQDTSFKEWNNFLPLLLDAMGKSKENSVLIVGDVKQSIYRWRGGDWRILGSKVAKQLPECVSDPLESNWRSLPEIVSFNKWLFDSAVTLANNSLNQRLDDAKEAKRISDKCHAELTDTFKRVYHKHAQKASRECLNKGYVSVLLSEGVVGIKTDSKVPCLVNSEGTSLYLERIRQVLEKGYKPCDITILVRKNTIGEKVAIELLTYSQTLPEHMRFEVTTEEALSLKSSPAVNLIIALMRLAVNRKDSESLILYNYYHRGFSGGAFLSDEENDFLDSIRSMSPDDAFEAISIRYAEDFKGQAAYTLALHEHIVQFSTGKVADLSLFDKWWRDKSDKLSVRVDRSEKAIEILTIHKSKGLENKVIILPDFSWTIEPRPDGYLRNIVWAEPMATDCAKEIGKFPVSFNKAVETSLFAEAYFRELVYSYVDAINLLYVATTRAKEQLHIFVEKSTDNTPCIDKPLGDIFKDAAQRVEGEKYFRYETGKFEAPEKEKEKKKNDKRVEYREVLNTHSVSPVSLKLRTTSARYFSDEETELTPRSKGIRMHRLFEEAATSADIFTSLDTMVENGELNESEAAELRQQIEEKLSTTEVGEWFDGSWERIFRERTIIQSRQKDGHKVEIKRPDRVMVRGKEAVVVDYKFGQETELHKKQIRHYMEMLSKMGYDSIKGYVWYVSSGKIVRI